MRFILIAISLFFLVGGIPAEAAYTMKVTVTFPKGSAGEKPAAKYPLSTKTSPCDNANNPTFDAVTFTVVYDASNSTKFVDRDVYFILYNPEGTQASKYLVLKKLNLGSNFNFVARNDVSELSGATDFFIPRTENLSSAGAVTDILISSAISLQSASSGIWQLIGIVADGNNPNLDFDNPKTWDAWDVGTVILRKPWAGHSNTICE